MGTLVVVLLLAVAGWVVWKLWKKPDMNNDGVVDAKDVVCGLSCMVFQSSTLTSQKLNFLLILVQHLKRIF